MRILVAEDDRRIAEALAAALQAAGFVAEVESDGEEAPAEGGTLKRTTPSARRNTSRSATSSTTLPSRRAAPNSWS